VRCPPVFASARQQHDASFFNARVTRTVDMAVFYVRMYIYVTPSFTACTRLCVSVYVCVHALSIHMYVCVYGVHVGIIPSCQHLPSYIAASIHTRAVLYGRHRMPCGVVVIVEDWLEINRNCTARRAFKVCLCSLCFQRIPSKVFMGSKRIIDDECGLCMK
jgi:hypothetical protein